MIDSYETGEIKEDLLSCLPILQPDHSRLTRGQQFWLSRAGSNPGHADAAKADESATTMN